MVEGDGRTLTPPQLHHNYTAEDKTTVQVTIDKDGELCGRLLGGVVVT